MAIRFIFCRFPFLTMVITGGVFLLFQPLRGSALAQTAPFYQGKTIRIIVGFTAGGLYDQYARILARHMHKYIPGNPNIIVQNMPGAGLANGNQLCLRGRKTRWFDPGHGGQRNLSRPASGAKRSAVRHAQIELYRQRGSKRSGALHESGCAVEIRGRYSVRYRAAQMWRHRDIRSNHDRAQHIRRNPRPQSKQRKRLSGRGRDRFGNREGGDPLSWHRDHHPLCSRALFHLDKNGFDRHIVQTGAKKDSRLPDAPTLNDLMDKKKTPNMSRSVAKLMLVSATLGRPLIATPGIPVDRVKILREAYLKAFKEPEVIAGAKKSRMDLETLTGEKVKSEMREVMNQPREVIERVKKLSE
jgi:hypothetical protein